MRESAGVCRALLVWAAALAAAASIASCGSDDDDAGGKSGGEKHSVAFLAASSQNGYNKAVFDGVEKAATERGVDVTILDGEFDATVQFNQLQDTAASGRYDGIVILPNDTVGIAAAVSQAAAQEIPVVTTLFPVGDDLNRMEPQVDGVVATVASPPARGASSQAEAVADFCADHDPCRVVILIGQLRFPFDNLRYKAFREVLDQHANIEVVARAEGNYDRDQSLQAMQDILQSNPDIDAVLSNADQHIFGAELALRSAGKDVESIFIIGGGGATQAVEKVRSGAWDADYANFPVSMGEAALEQVLNAIEGKQVKSVVDADGLGPVPPIVTTKSLTEEFPEFKGEWTD